ncbi:MAG TPA: serine/threonine-protein kinase [Opitutaceae bacterium]|jgi:tetratricopeptide (TPR) repeat protein
MNICPTCGAAASGMLSSGGLCIKCAGVRALEAELDTFGAEPASMPQRIGPYELLDEIGHGGMGRVFLARQEGLERIVALKVVSEQGFLSTEAELRFRREARTIARLHHPNIVTIHDMGRAEGCVYFSMEYIEGGDLARRLKERSYSPRQTAQLMTTVAAALAYAHREGVIHRDLKPSNILLDGEQPRLADFGLATDTEPGSDVTKTMAMLGTPHYLAPEAVKGGSRLLSTASDIYALGVVLFEMLTGRTPFAGATAVDLPRLLTEAEPPGPRLLSPGLPRDLETICLKCLEKDPAQRYATAQDLADDLGRFLRGDSIRARRPSFTQMVYRFTRRHRVGVASAASIALTLVIATIASVRQAVRATRAEQRAVAAAHASDEISKFLRDDVLSQADPAFQSDRDLKLRTALDNASRHISGRFADEPMVEADLRETLAHTYYSLGLFGEAENHERRTLALRENALPADDPSILRAMSDLASDLTSEDKFAEAEPLLRKAIATYQRVLGPANAETLNARNLLTDTYKAEGRLPEAEANSAQLLAVARAARGPDDLQTRTALQNLAAIYFAEEKYPESEKLNQEALDADIRVQGADSPIALSALGNLASVFWAEGKLQKSESENLRLLEIRRRIQGGDHPDTLRAMHNLATTYNDAGETAKAEEWERRALEGRRRALGPEHSDTLSSMSSLASDEIELGHWPEAIALGTQALAIERRVLGVDHFLTRNTMNIVARMLLKAGRLADAEALDRELLKVCVADPRTGPRLTWAAEAGLGSVLFAEKRYAESEASLRHVWSERVKSQPNDWATHAAASQLGEAIAAQGRFPEAESIELPAYRELAARAGQIPFRNRHEMADAGERIVRLYAAWRRPDEAESWRKRIAGAVQSS